MAWLALTCASSLAFGACDRSREITARPEVGETERHAQAGVPSGAPVDAEGAPLELEKEEVLVVELSEGETEGEVPPRPPTAETRPLSQSETQALLSRLPPLEDPFEGEDLALPPDSRPAPRAGETIEQPFPPQEEMGPPPDTTDEPLRVERHAPEGEVELAPHVSITFNQPMVPVTSQTAAAKEVPARLSPEIDGSWRWVGTRTLLFEADGRLPMATSYTVVVPAGTKSELGAVLQEEHRFSFETPPPSIESFYPSAAAQPLDTPIVIVFDQRVDAGEVLRHIEVRSNARRLDVQPLSADQIEVDEARRMVESAEEGRWVAFRTEEDLPYDSHIEVEVPAGTPSAEGPKTTTTRQTRPVRTYGPFRVIGTRCYGECHPGTPWLITLSNPIDLDAFDGDEHVRIEPELAARHVLASEQHIHIRGLPRADTTYRVHLPPEMKDVFGQNLEPTTPTFEVGPTVPWFAARPDPMVVLDPAGPPVLEIHSQGMRRLNVKAHSVEPGDWPAYQDWLMERTTTMPGRRLFERRVQVEGSLEEMSSTGIDLAEAFEEGLGHVVLRIQGSPQPKEQWRRQDIKVWVQSTRIGLMAAAGRSMEALAVGLLTGEPVEGATVWFLDDDGERLGPEATTDESGGASLALFDPDEPAIALLARKGGDLAILPSSTHHYRHAGWSRAESSDRILWYVADDRQMYKPGETAHFKGWVRVTEGGPEGDLSEVGREVREVSWKALDPRGSELASGTAPLDRFGGFSLNVELPEDANLGNARLVLQGGSGELASSRHHRFQIQAFRRPEF
ncbi:MAG: Ig-like domain-containing protein, partial [Myxococcota bacterium]